MDISVVGGELSQGHSGDLGFDLRAVRVHSIQDSFTGKMITKEDAKLHPYFKSINLDFPYMIGSGFRACFDTGLIVNFPDNIGGIIKPRSGLAFNQGIDVLAGVIDPGYRDTIKVILINHGSRAYQIKEGDRIAQLIPYRAELYNFIKSESITDTERGANGLGSTGVA